MDRPWLAQMNARHVAGDLLPPTAGLAPTQWKVPSADPLPVHPCRTPLLDRVLMAFIGACLAVSYALAGLVALGWWR